MCGAECFFQTWVVFALTESKITGEQHPLVKNQQLLEVKAGVNWVGRGCKNCGWSSICEHLRAQLHKEAIASKSILELMDSFLAGVRR